MVVIRRSEVPAYLVLRSQEIPDDDPRSRFMFDRHFVATRNALHLFGPEVLFACLLHIQTEAGRRHGLDYLQVFENSDKGCRDGKILWFIDDGIAVTALLPEDY